MQNEGIAYGDYLNHFPKENTIIIHYTFSIINSFIGTINWNLYRLRKLGSRFLEGLCHSWGGLVLLRSQSGFYNKY